VRAFDSALLTIVNQDTKSPRYRRYFSDSPSSIIRLGLESELDAALKRRTQAATSRTDHRVRSITTLIDDINGARLSLFGALLQKAAELHLQPDWPNRFFRRTTRSPKVQPAPTPPAGASG